MIFAALLSVLLLTRAYNVYMILNLLIHQSLLRHTCGLIIQSVWCVFSRFTTISSDLNAYGMKIRFTENNHYISSTSYPGFYPSSIFFAFLAVNQTFPPSFFITWNDFHVQLLPHNFRNGYEYIKMLEGNENRLITARVKDFIQSSKLYFYFSLREILYVILMLVLAFPDEITSPIQ